MFVEKNVYPAVDDQLLVDRIIKIFYIITYFYVYSYIFLHIFLSVTERLLNPYTCGFSSVTFRFIYFEVLFLGAYLF